MSAVAKRPVWQRAWFIGTAVFAIILLVVALQWDTTTQHPLVYSKFVQSVEKCLDSGRTCMLG